MMFVAYRISVRNSYQPAQEFHWRKVKESFRDAAWALLLPVIILGGIFSGWVTATEGAGLAVLAAAVIGGLVYRELSLPALRQALVEASTQTAVVMLLVANFRTIG